MPTEARDQRRAQRLENARRWGAWLAQAMFQAKIGPKDIVEGSHGAVDKGAVSHWLGGDYGASVENALIVARIVRRPPEEALRAAGHDAIADALADVQAESADRVRAYQARIADLEAQLDQRLAEPGSDSDEASTARNHGVC